LEAALELGTGLAEVALAERGVAGGEVALGEDRRRNRARSGERLRKPTAPFAHQPAGAPEADERAGEAQRGLDLACRRRPRERGADVVALLVEAVEPERLVRAGQ